MTTNILAIANNNKKDLFNHEKQDIKSYIFGVDYHMTTEQCQLVDPLHPHGQLAELLLAGFLQAVKGVGKVGLAVLAGTESVFSSVTKMKSSKGLVVTTSCTLPRALPLNSCHLPPSTFSS